MFTQQYYEEIVKVLKGTVGIITGSEASRIRSIIVLDFARMLEKDNEKFDKKKFLDAIYGKEVKV